MPSLPCPSNLTFSLFLIPSGMVIAKVFILPSIVLRDIFFSVPKKASSILTSTSVSMFSPFTGIFFVTFPFSKLFSPKNILKKSPIVELLFELLAVSSFLFLPIREFHILSYFLLEAISDKVLYASFISLNLSSENLLFEFMSG